MSFKVFSSIFSSGSHLYNFGRGYYGEHSCEIILNLDQWFRRSHLKIVFLFLALVVVLFGGVVPFVQFW